MLGKVVLTVEFKNKVLKCDHLNESSTDQRFCVSATCTNVLQFLHQLLQALPNATTVNVTADPEQVCDYQHESLFKIGLNSNTRQSSSATKDSHYLNAKLLEGCLVRGSGHQNCIPNYITFF